jgi:cystathionine beta-lyase family protein involved in aluminum resistance
MIFVQECWNAEKKGLYMDMPFHKEVWKRVEEAEQAVQSVWKRIDEIVLWNQHKVLSAFHRQQVADYHFAGSSGYGYNDRGREILEAVYADIFGAEAALVRPHIISGTHAIALALFGVLRPGDHLLYASGKPYDTLKQVIGDPGDKTNEGSLHDFGVAFSYVPLQENGLPDIEAVKRAIQPNTRMIGIQRSSGYDWRPSLTLAHIAELIRAIRSVKEDVVVFVDNCYGEFCERLEPTQVGADLVVGSLIKNPGGGLAPSGGYVVGKETYVRQAAARWSVPGIGAEGGAMFGTSRSLFQGLFLAPHIVGQALKGAVLAAYVFEQMGLNTSPRWDAERTDILQAIQFGDRERLIQFCQSIQASAPVDAHVRPEPWAMPGYQDEVIMAAGAFIQGSSIELSADGPIRPPYIGYMQGGLTYEHCKLTLMRVLHNWYEQH